MQNASLEFQDIMQRIELGMLSVPPCNNADIYFSEGIKPHRLVRPECNPLQDTKRQYPNSLRLQMLHDGALACIMCL